MSALEIGGLMGSLAAGFLSDRAVAKASLHRQYPHIGNPIIIHNIYFLVFSYSRMSITMFVLKNVNDTRQTVVLIGGTQAICCIYRVGLLNTCLN